MACDFCREVERRVVDDGSGATTYVTLGDRLAVDDGVFITLIPIRYCPMCGQDMREAINADS